DLAARTAKRAAAADRAGLLPGEFTTRYHQQFVDRLWLRGLAYAGLAYMAGLAVYFGMVGFRGYQTQKVEAAVAQISNAYTNTIQLKARLGVLQEREKLKYAALDCWKIVAEQLPQRVILQRMSFADGRKLSLSGAAPQDQINTLFDFNSAMQKATLNGQPMFDPAKGETVSPKTGPNNMATWNFSLELRQSEVVPE
ncbi:MAG TPA: hypothetical protein VIK53_14980, partial [Verrucomicrobiae bacterium]